MEGLALGNNARENCGEQKEVSGAISSGMSELWTTLLFKLEKVKQNRIHSQFSERRFLLWSGVVQEGGDRNKLRIERVPGVRS